MVGAHWIQAGLGGVDGGCARPTLLALLDAIGATPTILCSSPRPGPSASAGGRGCAWRQPTGYALLGPGLSVRPVLAGGADRRGLLSIHAVGLAAFGIVLVWLWVPIGFALDATVAGATGGRRRCWCWGVPARCGGRSLVRRRHRAPGATGNMVLIAGTDLVSRIPGRRRSVCLPQPPTAQALHPPAEDIPRWLVDFRPHARSRRTAAIASTNAIAATRHLKGALQTLVAHSHADADGLACAIFAPRTVAAASICGRAVHAPRICSRS